MATIVTFNVHSTGYAAMVNGYASPRLAALALQSRDLVENNEIIDFILHENFVITQSFDVYAARYSKDHYIRVRAVEGARHWELDPSGALDYGTLGIELEFRASVQFSYGVVVEGLRLKLNTENIPAIKLTKRGNDSALFPNGVFNSRIKQCKILVLGAGEAIRSSENASASDFTDNLYVIESASGGFFNTREGEFSRNTVVYRGAAAGRTAIKTYHSNCKWSDNAFLGSATPVDRSSNSGTFTNNYSDTAITGTATGVTYAASLVTSYTDLRPAAGSPLLGTATADAKNTFDVRNNFRGEAADIGAAMRVAAVAPPKPTIEITKIDVVGQKVVISGTYTGLFQSNAVTLAKNTSVQSDAVTQNGSLIAADGVWISTFTAVPPGSYLKPVATMTNISGTGSSTAGDPVIVTVTAPPTIRLDSREKTANSVTVSCTVTGFPTSGSMTITAVGGGAVTRTGPLTIDDSGAAFGTLTGVAAGEYDIKVGVTNYLGVVEAVGKRFTVYANGTQPQGLPSVDLPVFVAPEFNSPTVSALGVVAAIKITNSNGVTAANHPFTFGHPFKKGALRPQDKLIGKVSGQADIPLQWDVKATHPDGSVRHAIVSGVIPSLVAGATVSVDLVRSAVSVANVAFPSATAHNNGVRAEAIMIAGGVTYRANPSAEMLAGINGTGQFAKLHLKGLYATEYVVDVPFKDSNGNEHPYITAKFAMRYYNDVGWAKIDVSIENTKAYAIADVTYDMTITAGVAGTGTSRVIYSVTGLTHFYAARYRRVGWWHSNAATTISPDLYVGFDKDYLIDSMQIPNYDRGVVLDENAILSLVALENNRAIGPMKNGILEGFMPATAGRDDIGIMPRWLSSWVISQDKRVFNVAIRAAESMGVFSAHRRDRSTSGPVRGEPMDVIHWPYSTILGNVIDANNPATGINERIDRLTTANPTTPDTAHQPGLSYLPYMVTGDHYFLDELLFWAGYCGYNQHPGYRTHYHNLVKPDQVRGQGWTLRTWAETAVILPDDHPLKPSYVYYMDQNLAFYNAEYSDNPSANKLGINVTGNALLGDVIRTWQDDFFTWSIGHVAELGFPQAERLLRWKAKFVIGRLLTPGYCWLDAAIYSTMVRTSSSAPLFDNFPDVWAASVQDEFDRATNDGERASALYKINTPCAERMPRTLTGYPDSVTGFVANMQPAVACTLDSGVEDSDLAWELFNSRSVKPDYRYGNQFATLPRSVSADPIEYTKPEPPTIGTAVAGNGYVDVYFATNSNGNSPIIELRATLSTGESNGNYFSPIRVSASNGVARTATVTARNDYGTSDPSESSNSVTPVASETGATVPGAPMVSASAGQNSITVTVNPPVSNGGAAITSYTVLLSTGETITQEAGPFVFSELSAVTRTAMAYATNAEGDGPSSAPSNSVTPTAPSEPSAVTSVVVTPSVVQVSGGVQQQFSVQVNGTNSPSQSVTWAVSAGDINSAGLFTAPAASNVVQTITITATSVQDPTKSGTATVTIAALVQTVTIVTVSPSVSSIESLGTLQFAATVAGANSPPQSVTWGVTSGSISSSGLFTAPVVQDDQEVTVTATSTFDPSKSGSALVTVNPIPDVVYELESELPSVIVRTGSSDRLRLSLTFTDSPAPRGRTVTIGGASTTITSG